MFTLFWITLWLTEWLLVGYPQYVTNKKIVALFKLTSVDLPTLFVKGLYKFYSVVANVHLSSDWIFFFFNISLR